MAVVLAALARGRARTASLSSAGFAFLMARVALAMDSLFSMPE
jgi:hypothetical protein